MPKWLKFILAILLLPVCIGAANALWRVLKASGSAETFWVAMLCGAACWVVIFLLLPKPMWLYVCGHELTHALWTWLFAGRVKRIKISSKGGQVVISRSNFLIALAPYFFPFYVFVVVLLFALGHLIWNWKSYLVWFYLLIGAAYAFHVTLTGHVLRTSQSDITQHGYLFSGVIIFLGNIGVLLIGLPLLTARVELLTALGWFLSETGAVFHRLGQML